jgi:hypothetical protein
MPRVGFESTTPVLEQAKTVLALECATTVISYTISHSTTKDKLRDIW